MAGVGYNTNTQALISSRTSTSTAATSGTDPLALQGVVSNLLSLQGQAQELDAAAQGSLLNAEGADAEAAAYGTAAGIADENQRAEAMAEEIRQIQIQREVDQTVGGISASTAANGFAQSGSALDIMASSYQQGHLSEQISGMQSQQVQRGYFAESAAAQGEMAAATVRGDAARLLADTQSSAANSARANQAALTDALTQLLKGDPNGQKLVNDILAGDTAAASADALLYNPAGAGQPLTGGTTDPLAAALDPLSHGVVWDATDTPLVMSTGNTKVSILPMPA